MNSTDFCMIRTLVLNYLNERCGLPPGRGLSCDVIHSKEVYLVLELKTNYKRGVPGGKMAEVIAQLELSRSSSDSPIMISTSVIRTSFCSEVSHWSQCFTSLTSNDARSTVDVFEWDSW